MYNIVSSDRKEIYSSKWGTFYDKKRAYRNFEAVKAKK